MLLFLRWMVYCQLFKLPLLKSIESNSSSQSLVTPISVESKFPTSETHHRSSNVSTIEICLPFVLATIPDDEFPRVQPLKRFYGSTSVLERREIETAVKTGHQSARRFYTCVQTNAMLLSDGHTNSAITGMQIKNLVCFLFAF